MLTRREFGVMAGSTALAVTTTSAPAARADDLSPDERARDTERRMTDDERFSLISSLMVVDVDGERESRVPEDVPEIAGYVPGIPRLGVPAQKITDGPLGITNPSGERPGDVATALPSGQALGATFNLALARETGAILGREARARGFNVVCAGGINLARDPRNGRNFEYVSEDPLLSAAIGAEVVLGVQAQGVLSTLKHLSLNVNETNKWWLDAVIDPAAHRESDLLAFQIAIERARPGAVMAAYNKLNGEHCCGNAALLNDTLKRAFGFQGYVMSDWKAVYGWEFALNGLDQQSGAQLDDQEWFNGPLRDALAEERFPPERLSEMVRRILRSIYAIGLDRWGPRPDPDLAAHNATALEIARQGIVLLKNEAALPLAGGKSRIAAIGGRAQFGVLSGGGSSQTVPAEGYAALIPLGGEGPVGSVRQEAFLASSPLSELRKLLPEARVAYSPGTTPAEAVALAKRSEVAIVFVTKFEAEAYDSADLSLPYGQDAVIAAVATANPNTIVVLETGNPVEMPWHDKVKAIVAAWYPGQAGGQAIAELLTGRINPSGRLPVTFPAGLAQTPRPELPGYGEPFGTPVTIRYGEGAEVGYRWFAKQDSRPLYPFGHGLSFTRFAYRDLVLTGGDTVTARFTVTNTGSIAGVDVPQLYLTEAAGDKRTRLLGFERVSLQPGESQTVTIGADPRLLARFDTGERRWRIAPGTHRVALGASAEDLRLHAETQLPGRLFGS